MSEKKIQTAVEAVEEYIEDARHNLTQGLDILYEMKKIDEDQAIRNESEINKRLADVSKEFNDLTGELGGIRPHEEGYKEAIEKCYIRIDELRWVLKLEEIKRGN